MFAGTFAFHKSCWVSHTTESFCGLVTVTFTFKFFSSKFPWTDAQSQPEQCAWRFDTLKWGSPPLKRFSLDKEAWPIQVRDKSSHIAASFFRDFKKHCEPGSLSCRFVSHWYGELSCARQLVRMPPSASCLEKLWAWLTGKRPWAHPRHTGGQSIPVRPGLPQAPTH